MGEDLTDRDDGASSEGGSAGVHRSHRVSFKVAPASGDAFDTVRPALRAVACWRIDDLRFDFDSSFLLPDGANEFRLLAARRPPDEDDPTKGLLMSVFGHADPTGTDAYNRVLAGRRARAVYAVLVRDATIWEDLYSTPTGGDAWSYKHLQLLLSATGHPPGRTDGASSSQTTSALRDFQRSAGVPVTGYADHATRAKLFLAYMEVLWVDGRGAPFRYRSKDFLGRGELEGGKAAVQSCGELNPLVVFDKQRQAYLDEAPHHPERDAANATNRRVLVFMFPNDTQFPVHRWPCPTAKEDGAACKRQLWPDGDARRSPNDRRREHLKGGRTFACRFYDSLARGSPCEGVRQTLALWLLDDEGRRMPNTPYRVRVGAQLRRGRADDRGMLVEKNLLLGAGARVEWGDTAPREGEKDASATGSYFPLDAYVPDRSKNEFRFRSDVFLDADEADDEAGTDRRLSNLGYVGEDRSVNLERFSADYGAEGTPSSATIQRAHDEGQERKQAKT